MLNELRVRSNEECENLTLSPPLSPPLSSRTHQPVFRISDFGLPSAFGFRPSDFTELGTSLDVGAWMLEVTFASNQSPRKPPANYSTCLPSSDSTPAANKRAHPGCS